MGREAITVARWRGEVEEVKALLESQEIILRGALKARIARSGISMIAVDGDELTLRSDGEPFVLELGAKEATKWRDALLKPPPSLASKLGIGAEKRAFVIGTSEDEELIQALAGASCATLGEAGVLLAIITSEADLILAYAVATQNMDIFVWCIYPKGKNTQFGDADVRSFMRNGGYIDNKSCAVSSRLTATRYGRKT